MLMKKQIIFIMIQKKNQYYDLVDKYRLLNNAIKHGGIDELKKIS